jgi:hypothetical protein
VTGLEMIGVTITSFVTLRGSGAIINHTGDTAFRDHTGVTVANLASAEKSEIAPLPAAHVLDSNGDFPGFQPPLIII